MIAQKLAIAPKGIIKEGFIQYSVDTVSGLIDWASHVVVGLFMFNKTFDNSGSVKLDPKSFLSATWAAGMKFTMGPVTISVVSISPDKVATCQIKVYDAGNQIDESGAAYFDLSQTYISVKSLRLAGTIQGYDVNVSAS